MQTPEGKEKQKLKAYLNSIGAYHHSPVPIGFGGSTNDIIACIVGQFWLLEVKAEGRKPTPRQNITADAVIAAGGLMAWGTAEKIIGEIEAWHNAQRNYPAN